MIYYADMIYMYIASLKFLRVLADVLVFSATILYLAIIFGGLRIPSHIYHDLHKVFKLLLAGGLILTSMYSCQPDGVLKINNDLTRLHCGVSSKFGLVMGILILITSVVSVVSTRSDADRDGTFSYSDFSDFVDELGEFTFSEKFKSNMFDLLGGDKSARIARDTLPAMFFPLA